MTTDGDAPSPSTSEAAGSGRHDRHDRGRPARGNVRRRHCTHSATHNAALRDVLPDGTRDVGPAPRASIRHRRLRLCHRRTDLSSREARPAVSPAPGLGGHRRPRLVTSHRGVDPQRWVRPLRSRPPTGTVRRRRRHLVGLATLPGHGSHRPARRGHPCRHLLRHGHPIRGLGYVSRVPGRLNTRRDLHPKGQKPDEMRTRD